MEDIPLDDIPIELQCLVIEKLDHFSFFALWRTNKDMAKLCESEASKIVHPVYILQYKYDEFQGMKVDEGYHMRKEQWETFTKIKCRIHADILEITDILSDELVEYFIKEFKKLGTKVKDLSGRFHVTCSVENFDELLKIAQIKSIETHKIPGKYFSCSSMKKMETLLVEHPLHLHPGELPSLKASLLRLKLPYVSNGDLNAFFKQWRRKERKVVSVTIHRNFTDEDIDEIVEGIDANLVWSEAYHNLSEIASFKEVAFPESRLYCLFHHDDIDNILLLLFLDGSICFYPDVDVSHALSDIIG